MLKSSTYTINTPQSKHPINITITNEDKDGVIAPCDLFINSLDAEHYQWFTALSFVISACFKGGAFDVEGLINVFDPKGGYFKKGVFMPSLVAEIAAIIDKHIKELN